MAQEQVVLVDEHDAPRGLMEKIEAHEKGLLHRAFSAYVIRQRSGETELLLQLRARTKYHFGGLWTNTCCGHPRDGETPVQAGERRLPEEMNIRCALRPIGSFVYRATSDNGLIEHEFDHALLGMFDDELPAPNPEEVDAVRWISLSALDAELAQTPERYTPWFGFGYAKLRQALRDG